VDKTNTLLANILFKYRRRDLYWRHSWQMRHPRIVCINIL